ncbi:hypothetical protein [Glycomyces paridis]|uniref:Condensation domain-containing protein n=1 Tax=Glycomyces paridis TaxID=2126555 RepID=A0A4V4HPL1_9ACTN|nr:hypothetical protein [Glycomyces paridis]THV30216.1 hypothetical protein E9998_07545 [Glycomyces paridis]
MTATLRIEFDAGHPDLAAPMTWGQRAVLEGVRRFGDDGGYFNHEMICEVPQGRSLADLAAAFADVLAEFAVLRTRFADDEHGPRQLVSGSGALELELRLIGADGTVPLQPGEAKSFRFADYDRCVRGAVVCAGDTPVLVALAVSHLALDCGSYDLVKGRIEARLRGDRTPAAVVQTTDQSDFERSPAALRRSAAAMRFWGRELRAMPASMTGAARPSADPLPFKSVRIRSSAMSAAATRIAERLGVSTAAVLLAANGVLLRDLTGAARQSCQLIVGNRYTPRDRTVAAAMAQNGLLNTDLDGLSFDDLVRLCFRRSLATYKHGFYDPDALEELRTEIEAERGAPLDLSIYFNDARAGGGWPERPEAKTRSEVADLLEETVIEPDGAWPRHDATLFTAIGRDRRSCELSLLFDSRKIEEAAVEPALRAIEGLLVEAVE